MAYSEAKKKATIKYQKKTYDRIELKVKKGEKEKNILEQNYYCIDNTYRHCDWSGKADSLGSIKDQRRRYAKNKQGIE